MCICKAMHCQITNRFSSFVPRPPNTLRFGPPPNRGMQNQAASPCASRPRGRRRARIHLHLCGQRRRVRQRGRLDYRSVRHRARLHVLRRASRALQARPGTRPHRHAAGHCAPQPHQWFTSRKLCVFGRLFVAPAARIKTALAKRYRNYGWPLS